MIDRKIKNKAIVIKKVSADQYQVERAPLKGLVLSGGGARGLAYVGMYQTLKETKALDNISHVAGASAGAMAASLIALGTPPEDFEKISTEIDMNKLIDASLIKGRSDGSRFRNVLELIYLFQFQGMLTEQISEADLSGVQKNYYNQLQEKIIGYQAVLSKFQETSGIEIQDLTGLINFINANDNVTENFQSLNEALKSIPTNKEHGKNLRFTLGDITKLRSIMPEQSKHLIKHLSVAVTNKTTQSQMVFSSEGSPTESIAEKVMQSGAHPLMFRPQMDENRQIISDGGVLDNMPSNALEQLGLEKKEILCVKVNQENQVHKQLERARSPHAEKPSISHYLFDAILASSLGGAHKKSSLDTREREKVFYDMGNMLFLNSGTIKATTTRLSDEQRKHAIESGRKNTHAMLTERDMQFTHLLDTLLYVGEDELEKLIETTDTNSQPELFKTAAFAQMLFLYQKNIILELTKEPKSDVNRDIIRNGIMAIQQALQDPLINNMALESTQQNKSLALCLKQINFATEGKLSTFLEDEITIKPSNGAWAMQLLLFLATPFKMIYQLFSKPTNEYQQAKADELDKSEHAQNIKQLLQGDDRLFNSEPLPEESRNAIVQKDDEPGIEPPAIST